MVTIIFGCLQGTLTAIRDWFRDYKIPDGKPANRFGLGNQAVNKVLLLHKSIYNYPNEFFILLLIF